LTFFGKIGFEQAVNAGKPCRIDLHAESPDALISAIMSDRGPRHEANAEIGTIFPMQRRVWRKTISIKPYAQVRSPLSTFTNDLSVI
jgi:hypothetical protein